MKERLQNLNTDRDEMTERVYRASRQLGEMALQLLDGGEGEQVDNGGRVNIQSDNGNVVIKTAWQHESRSKASAYRLDVSDDGKATIYKTDRRQSSRGRSRRGISTVRKTVISMSGGLTGRAAIRGESFGMTMRRGSITNTRKDMLDQATIADVSDEVLKNIHGEVLESVKNRRQVHSQE